MRCLPVQCTDAVRRRIVAARVDDPEDVMHVLQNTVFHFE
jgi:hypothetical protein